MRARRFRFRRYQLKKQAVQVLREGHPWVFRGALSTAAEVFPDGQWLALVDGQNRSVGYGVYQAEGAVGIRILRAGGEPPDLAWFRRQVHRALERRLDLRRRVEGFRALNGESDGLPGVVLDVFGRVGVLQTYSTGVDALGRYAAALVGQALDLVGVLWKPPQRRLGGGGERRILRGRVPESVAFREEGLTLVADLAGGQKTGLFLDLRGLRRWILGRDLKGRRVLNLFCYTGTLGLAAEQAGAREVWQVDSSGAALALARHHHTRDPRHHRFLEEDVFEWLQALPGEELFDLVVVDPPALTTRTDQVDRVLGRLARLYSRAAAHVTPGGTLVACDCTSRLPRTRFQQMLKRAVPLRHRQTLLPEVDHTPRFPEADYLKVEIYR